MAAAGAGAAAAGAQASGDVTSTAISAVFARKASQSAAASASRASDTMYKMAEKAREAMKRWALKAMDRIEGLTEPVTEILNALVEDGLIDIKAGTDLADAILTKAQKQSEEWIDKAASDANAEIIAAEKKAGRALTDAETTAIFQTKAAETKAVGAIGDALQNSLEYFTPYIEAGKKGLSLFDTIESDVTLSPLFKLQQEEGEKAIDRAFAKRGLRGSGANIKALKDFNEELTATETERQYQRIFERGKLLSDYGFGASQLAAGAEMAAGKSLADVHYGTGGRLAEITTGAGTARAGLAERAGGERAGVKERSGKYKAGLASIYGPARADLAMTGTEKAMAMKQWGGTTYLDFLTNQQTYLAEIEKGIGEKHAALLTGASALGTQYSVAAGLIKGASLADIGAMTAEGVSNIGQYVSNLFKDTGGGGTTVNVDTGGGYQYNELEDPFSEKGIEA